MTSWDEKNNQNNNNNNNNKVEHDANSYPHSFASQSMHVSPISLFP
jgi:hypothetical protein